MAPTPTPTPSPTAVDRATQELLKGLKPEDAALVAAIQG
jgi:hypothetical protein